MPTYIPLSAIVRDARLQSRAAGLNEDHVAELADALKAGRKVGPIKVCKDGNKFFPHDGWHRIAAYERVGGCSEIEAEVEKGTLDDAILKSAAANIGHGLKRTPDDNRHAISVVLDHQSAKGWSDGRIADHVGVSRQYVAKIRSELSEKQPATRLQVEPQSRVGRDGKTRRIPAKPQTAKPSTNGHASTPPPLPEPPDDDPTFEPPITREPGEDDDEPPVVTFPQEWTGAKFKQLIDAVKYLEDKVTIAESIVVKRISRLFPHHGLPLKRWNDELASKASDLKRFRQKLETAKCQSAAR